MQVDRFREEVKHWFAAMVATLPEERFRSDSTDVFEALYQCNLLSEVGKRCNVIILRDYRGQEFAFEDTGAAKEDQGDESWVGCFEEIDVDEAKSRIAKADSSAGRIGQVPLFEGMT